MVSLVVMDVNHNIKIMKKLVVIIATTVLFLSCNQTSKDKLIIDTSSIKIEGVSTNNGELWKANIETTEGIKKMQELMYSFSDEENVNAYASLKTSLEEEFTTIFQKCTMKGESHNQLHNYLKPMIEIFEGLESSDLETCKENFSIMNTHLAGYQNYFE